MTTRKAVRPETGDEATTEEHGPHNRAGNQPAAAPAPPAPLTPQALNRLRARLARKYH